MQQKASKIKHIVLAAAVTNLYIAHASANIVDALNKADINPSVISASQDAPQKDQILPPQEKSTQMELPKREANTPSNWPSGADAIIESYGNWTFECRMFASQPKCSINQKLANQLAIELITSADGTDTKAMIILPFGLQIAQGATIFIDGKPADHRVPFSTCTPEGCLIPLTMPPNSMEHILKSKQMKIVSFDNATGQSREFTIALDGISHAFNRLVEYTRQN